MKKLREKKIGLHGLWLAPGLPKLPRFSDNVTNQSMYLKGGFTSFEKGVLNKQENIKFDLFSFFIHFLIRCIHIKPCAI